MRTSFTSHPTSATRSACRDVPAEVTHEREALSLPLFDVRARGFWRARVRVRAREVRVVALGRVLLHGEKFTVPLLSVPRQRRLGALPRGEGDDGDAAETG